MSSEGAQLSEAQKRRKRINLYKKIIVITLLVLILLPTLLCIILFTKLHRMSNEISELKSMMAETKESEERVVEIETTEEETTTEVTTTTPAVNASEKVTMTSEEAKSYKELHDEAIANGKKVVYLTFDDGPSVNTERLLDTLDEYNVKATFFVICNSVYDNYVKEIVDRGHTLAMHTYTHDYAHVYGSLSNFKEEVDDLQNYLFDLTGYKPFIFRFPGGSSNSMTTIPISNFIDYLNSKGIVYYDWNVSSGDGGSTELTVDEVYNNVISGIEKNTSLESVVLMHDSEYRETTLLAVPKIIEKLQEMDVVILPITEDTTPVHHNI